ncbi:hypothetical protein [Liquorilactobacillus hordei]|uniref:hypothetical protein n=1 Tax=Liquorilactobacillus hordei TaxID=468911 RepID=UPI0039E98B01
MRLADFYTNIKTQLKSDGITVIFRQPTTNDTLPLVQVGVHTDSDASTKFGPELNEVEQQIDVWTENVSVIEFEEYVRQVKLSLSKCVRWNNLTVQTMIDESIGRDLRRALFLMTITI